MKEERARQLLITGAGGYVGLSLTAALADSCRLRCLVRREAPFREALEGAVPDPAARRAIEVIEGDICDPETARRACKGVDVIVHLAALTGDEQPGQFNLLQTNLLGCRFMLEGAKQEGVTRFILTSTYHVYGRLRTLPPGPVSEEIPLNPVSVYASSKALAEKVARSSGLQEVVVRLPHLYGAGVGDGDWGGVLLRFIDQAIQDSAITLDAGAADVRDYLHISDAVDCLRRLALAGGPLRGTFNVGSGESVTLREMAEWIAEAAGKLRGRKVDLRVPAGAESPACRATLDLRRIREACGFEPKIKARQGIAELLGRLAPAA